MATIEQSRRVRGKRARSRLSRQLSEAFAPCAEWSEVRLVERRRGRAVWVAIEPRASGAASASPYDWAAD